MPEQTLDEIVKPAFDELKNVLSKGNIVREIKTNKSGKQIRYNNFPGMADNLVTHVRPHRKYATDTVPLPATDKLTGLNSFTKQCFWLNNSYVGSIVGLTKTKIKKGLEKPIFFNFQHVYRLGLKTPS